MREGEVAREVVAGRCDVADAAEVEVGDGVAVGLAVGVAGGLGVGFGAGGEIEVPVASDDGDGPV